MEIQADDKPIRSWIDYIKFKYRRQMEIQMAVNTNIDGSKCKHKWQEIQMEANANTNGDKCKYRWRQIQMCERIIRHELSGADTIS